MNYTKPHLARRLADEYVLGTLQGRARTRFERLIHTTPFLQALVHESEQHWNTLAQTLPATKPSDATWQRIEARITPTRSPSQRSGGLFASLGFWRGWALAGSLVIALLGVRLAVQPELPTAVNLVVVITDDARSQASWVLNARPDAGLLAVRALAPQALPEARTHQLWMKLPGESKVRSLGLIPASGKASLKLDSALAAALPRAEKFGVSVEPPGGSPTGQPTTTPLYHGQLVHF